MLTIDEEAEKDFQHIRIEIEPGLFVYVSPEAKAETIEALRSLAHHVAQQFEHWPKRDDITSSDEEC